MFKETTRPAGVAINIKELLLIIAFITYASYGQASVLHVTADKDFHPLATHLKMLRDLDGKLTIEQVSDPSLSSAFTHMDNMDNIDGLFDRKDLVYWFQLKLLNPENSSKEWWLDMGTPMLDMVVLHQKGADGRWALQTVGYSLPPVQNKVNTRRLVLPVTLGAQSQETIYLAVRAQSILPLNMRLWSPQDYQVREQGEKYLLILFFGGLGILVLYNIFLGLTINDNSYLLCGLLLLVVGMNRVNLNGFAYQLLTPNDFFWGGRGALLWSALIIFFAALFCRSYLKMAHNHPYLNKVFITLALSAILVACLSQIIVFWLGLLSLFFITTAISLFAPLTALLAAWSGHRPGYHCLLAMASLCFFYMLRVLEVIGVLAQSLSSPYVIELATLATSLLFTFGLAERFKQQDSAHKATQSEAKPRSIRYWIIIVMHDALLRWEEVTGKGKVDLAEESRLWRVHIDNGRLRTRVMDRYFKEDKLPTHPRWREVVKTARFVLAQTGAETKGKKRLENSLQSLIDALSDNRVS
jgi:hypothetical protein